MSKLKSTFQKKTLRKKNIKNYFDNDNFDRSASIRNDKDWYEKLDKNDIIYIPIWMILRKSCDVFFIILANVKNHNIIRN